MMVSVQPTVPHDWEERPEYQYAVGETVVHFRRGWKGTVVSFHPDGAHVFVHVDGQTARAGGLAFARWAWKKEMDAPVPVG